MTDSKIDTAMLDALESKARAATPGPWEQDNESVHDKSRDRERIAVCDEAERWDENAALIAACSPEVIGALVAEVKHLRSRAADVDDAKRIWADETLRKVPRLADGTEFEVGTRVVFVDEERRRRVGLGYQSAEVVHEITGTYVGSSPCISLGPEQVGFRLLRRAPEGAAVTCPACAGWHVQMAKMRVDSEVYRETREIERQRDAAIVERDAARAELAQKLTRLRVRLVVVRSYDDTATRVEVDGALLGYGTYGGEPEDNCEYRDYSWVRELLASLAARLGAEVSNAEVDMEDAKHVDWAAVAFQVAPVTAELEKK